jgi:glycosyltransferase involved in cell wall biosynthesis
LAHLCDLKVVAITSRALPDLPEQHRALFDEVRTNAYERKLEEAWFLQLSPMTHAPVAMARLLQPSVSVRASIVYDFIPYDVPERYLVSPEARKEYLCCLAWLSDYNLFLPISEYSAERLSCIMGIDEGSVSVTGVAVRSSLVAPETKRRTRGHVLVVGGGDPRKNVECPVVAHAQSVVLNKARVRLVIGGYYPPGWQAELRALHKAKGGDSTLLHFLDHVTDAELARQYADALVVVCPSKIEGFSIPVIEANANGAPVLISDCAAQTELMRDPRDWFPADDVSKLTSLIESIFSDPKTFKAVVSRQRDVWKRFTADAVGERFWSAFAAAAETRVRSPAVRRGAKPVLAFAGPMPPDPSGVADYTAACVKALLPKAEVHLYTDTVAVSDADLYRTVQAVSAEAYVSLRFDAAVSVIGNSHFHTSAIDHLQRFGGAAILHDARMINFYAVCKGEREAVDVASRELKRPVSWDEVARWLDDQRQLPTLFMKDLIEASSPPIVHSPTTQDLIHQMYDRRAELLPFAIYREPPSAALTNEGRTAAKAALGLPPGRKLIATFGSVAPDKSPETLAWAVHLLNAWGIDAEAAFVGSLFPDCRTTLTSIADDAGLTDRLTLFEGPVSNRVYDLYLAACDAAVQLRTYHMGGLSGAVLDCIAAGVPLVMNAHLAEAVRAPETCHTVPDSLSPVLVAEQLAHILSESDARERTADRNSDFISTHSMNSYTDRLLELLL